MFHFVVVTQITDTSAAERLNNLFRQLFTKEEGIVSIVFNQSWSNNLATFQVRSSVAVSPNLCVKLLEAIEEDRNATVIAALDNSGLIDLSDPKFSANSVSTHLAFFLLQSESDPRLGGNLLEYIKGKNYFRISTLKTKFGLVFAYQSEDEIGADLIVDIGRIAKASVLIGLFG